MSRVGKNPIDVPKDVKVSLEGKSISIEGPKGRLDLKVPSPMKVDFKDNQILVTRPSNSKLDRSRHGLARSLIYNMVEGVTKGYKKELEITGVGYRAQLQNKALTLQLGFSHPVIFPIPAGIDIECPKPTQILVKGIDKAKVGQVTAKIRAFYKPEPYKGKGIKYTGEYVRRKAGKAVA